MAKIAVIQCQYMVSKTEPQKGITTGGEQRYTIQLAKLLARNGYEVFVLARANVPCEDLIIDEGRVIVVPASMDKDGDRIYSKYVYEFCVRHAADFVCYVDLQIAKYSCYPGSLAIQHGIGWDGPVSLLSRAKRYLRTRDYLRAASRFEKIICVDTNFINWARENDRHFFKHPGKYVYLPNFADETDFTYAYREWTEEDELILLYPRRLVEYRGYKLFIGMCEALKAKGYNVHPVLAFEENASDDYSKLLEGKKCRYEVIHPGLGEISSEYKRAFLTFVPTIWSEGTSLSAIEAICSGCPVITSDVGGLGNIVIPDLTGDIASPTVESFTAAAEAVLRDPGIRNRWAKNCELVRESFLTKRWNEKMMENIP